MSLKITYSLCGHCDQLLSEKTLKEHKRLYFHDGQWIRAQSIEDEQQSVASSPISLSSADSLSKSPSDSLSSLLSLSNYQGDIYSDQESISEDIVGKFHLRTSDASQ